MAQLSKFKGWYFLNDAAKCLSKQLGEEWTDKDVLQAVFERHLSLSWNVMVKHALPADVEINDPRNPIVDTSLIQSLRGQYRIVLEDNNVNMCVDYNIREEWLMRLLKEEPAMNGMVNDRGFLIEDSSGKSWRPLRSVERKIRVSGLFCSETNEITTTVVPHGYYPQLIMPDLSELVIRKLDLEKILLVDPPKDKEEGVNKGKDLNRQKQAKNEATKNKIRTSAEAMISTGDYKWHSDIAKNIFNTGQGNGLTLKTVTGVVKELCADKARTDLIRGYKPN